MMLSRRGLIGGVATLPLAGCGFHPVYMPSAGDEPGVAQRELGAIYVAIIPDRPGQELRQALQQRLGGTGADPKPLYTLHVNYWIAGEGIAIQPDTSVTRIRLFGNANWNLVGRDPAQTPITKGFARAEDAVNVIDNGYFSSDLQNEAADAYLAQALADQIAMRLAVFFRNKAGTGS
jgi:LPS-assembly lipoprotein